MVRISKCIKTKSGHVIKLGDMVGLSRKDSPPVYGRLLNITQSKNRNGNVTIDESEDFHYSTVNCHYDSSNNCVLKKYDENGKLVTDAHLSEDKLAWCIDDDTFYNPTIIIVGDSILHITTKSGKSIIGRLTHVECITNDDNVLYIDCSGQFNGKTMRIKSKKIKAIELKDLYRENYLKNQTN